MKRKGFTLIEIMLVVIIIGILVAMVMPRLVGRSEQARIQAANADINGGIALAMDLFETDIGHYPDKIEDLRVNPGLGDKWKGPYLKKDPKDPWGNSYIYKKISASEYELSSAGPNGQAGDADDISNK